MTKLAVSEETPPPVSGVVVLVNIIIIFNKIIDSSLKLKSGKRGGKGRAKLKEVSCMQWGCGEQDPSG